MFSESLWKKPSVSPSQKLVFREEEEPDVFRGGSWLMTISAGNRLVSEVGIVLLEHGVVRRGVVPEAFLGQDNFLFPAKLGNELESFPKSSDFINIFEGPGSIFPLKAKPDHRKI